ncbi:MAG: C_GCAxxG_C_C family protein [Asgard group archaeon]|nr:C_GCAxxG_C_C family protein [Asgard group archaeon]
MMSDKAKDFFSTGYNCAQAVLRAVLEEKKLYFDQAPIVSAGFGGGISRRGEMCGAVTGAVMAIGMLTHETEQDVSKHKALTYQKVTELINKFNEIHETPICSELVGIDITDPEARKKASDEGIFSKICPKFVEDAAKIVLELFP